MSHSFECF